MHSHIATAFATFSIIGMILIIALALVVTANAQSCLPVIETTQKIVTTSADGAQSVFAADIDGDGRMDLASASWRDDKISWYRNVNGDGSQWSTTVVTTSADGA